MAFFKKNNQNYSTTIKKQTVMVNGKVVSESNPEIEVMRGNAKNIFHDFFDENDRFDESSNPDEIGKFVENALRMAGISGSDESFQLEGSSPSPKSQPRTLQCKGCGAHNVIVPGSIAVCEYCGSGLE